MKSYMIQVVRQNCETYNLHIGEFKNDKEAISFFKNEVMQTKVKEGDIFTLIQYKEVKSIMI